MTSASNHSNHIFPFNGTKWKKVFMLFGGFNVLHFIYWLIIVKWGAFFDANSFYFSASLSEFSEWFPMHYWWLFSLMMLFKFLAWSTLLFSIASLLYFRNRLLPLATYNNGIGYNKFMASEAMIAFVALFVYVGWYLVLKLPNSLSGTHFANQAIAHGFLFHLIFQTFLIGYTQYQKVLSYLKNYFLTPSLPHNIAILRILFFSYLIFIYYGKYGGMIPTISLTEKYPLPFIGWLIEIIPVNADIYRTFYYLGVMCCVFIVLGFKTRFFLILNAICCFYIIATPNFFGKIWHEQLVIWIAWFFTFSRCYDMFSIDSILKKAPIVKCADYTYPVRFVWIQLGIIYLWAGFYKLWDSGFDWALSQHMVYQVQLEWLQHYDKVPYIRIDHYPVLLYLGGLAAIIFELFYIFLVLNPAIRWVSFSGGLLMHNIIGYFMYISFFSLLQVFYVCFLNFNAFFEKITEQKNVKIITNVARFPFIIGVIILSLNFLFGMFSVSSYPFSAYPKYAVLIPEKIKIVHFVPKSNDTSIVNVHQIGKKNGFRWESYGWMEYNIINNFESGENVENDLRNYWEIWRNYNPELKEYENIEVYLTSRPVSPEGKDSIEIIGKMGEVHFE